jgi:hypothetical protein
MRRVFSSALRNLNLQNWAGDGKSFLLLFPKKKSFEGAVGFMVL